MLRFPRLQLTKYTLSPSTKGGHRRISSPSGDSILMTSAPISAANMVATGPAILRVQSMIRMPLSMPKVSIFISDTLDFRAVHRDDLGCFVD